MRPEVGAGWRFIVALLCAVFTSLLFTSGHLYGREDKPSDDYVIAGDPDIPHASRQDSPEYSARRDGDDSGERDLDSFESVATYAYSAWLLPTSSAAPRSRETGSRHPRGPPAC
ncbi:hypothetical protein [Nannocystis radixulma]|uniref:Uncharacterized protein n=1 Tax=Nannocystis radixulma TaxID=2995305 RepID=A0ABT5BST8_9BACT|nr:hypothetical protein [Nannocystis radixulma]MDC0676042.1 hypothetical protein [Nannocystis radixulma]